MTCDRCGRRLILKVRHYCPKTGGSYYVGKRIQRNPNQQLLSRYLKEQGLLHGHCTLCKRVGNLVLDHDHKTGEFRARLCSSCNVGLGMFKDDPYLLRSAADYIIYHHTKK